MELSCLMPPADLVVQNGIGIGQPDNIAREFHEIGHGLVAELIRDGLRPDHRVLDVGCGLGRLARALADYLSPGGSYDGTDVTKSSIDWCKNAYRDVPCFNFTHSDVLNTHYNPTATGRAADYVFPFPDNFFDFAFSTSLFTHLTLIDAVNYIRQIARVLKRGGRAWNTFFLLDEVSEPLAATSASPNVRMRFEVDGGRVVLADDPEAVIGLRADIIRASHDKCGLVILEVRNGPWSGRVDDLKASYQDVVIAMKP